jgi:hydroxymethylglutaryl-CoA reductase (NADPH)
MGIVPSLLLKQLYTFGSLRNTANGVQFAIKNRLSDAELTELQSITIDDRPVPASALRLDLGDGASVTPGQISGKEPVAFPLRKTLTGPGRSAR